ncbi:Hok/Gef family protein [Escherichia coli]
MLGGADNPNGELLSYIIGADICEVRIRTGQTEVAVFTAYEPEE